MSAVTTLTDQIRLKRDGWTDIGVGRCSHCAAFVQFYENARGDQLILDIATVYDHKRTCLYEQHKQAQREVEEQKAQAKRALIEEKLRQVQAIKQRGPVKYEEPPRQRFIKLND